MSHSYYLNNGNETTGPFPLADLQARLAAGTLPPGALLHNGQAWVPATDFLRSTAAAPVPTPTASAPVSAAPNPTVSPERALQEALLLEKEPPSVLTDARWESLLFLLSFPVLSPSLILMFIMAKRWGHIDIYLIIIDGLIFTGLAFLSGPWLGVMMLTSWISSVYLYWLRRDRQGHGIFLGYSYLVSFMLIFGGAFAIGGFVTMFPWNAYARWSAARENAIVTTVERVRDRALPRDRRILLQGATLDFENPILRQKIGGQWKFVSKDAPPELTYNQSGLRLLSSNFQVLHGRQVRLDSVPSSAFGGVRGRVEIQDGASKRWLDTKSLHFTLITGSEGRLWIASAAPLPSGNVSARGLARIIYNDPTIASTYAETRRGNLPLMGVAVFDGERPPAPPTPEAEEMWVSVKSEQRNFWVRFPAGTKPTGKEKAAGYYHGDAPDFSELRPAAAGRSSSRQGHVLYQQSTDAYLAEEGIVGQMKSSVAWKNGLWLGVGLLVLGGAVWRAREE